MPGPMRLERGGRLRHGGVYGAPGGDNDVGILSESAVGEGLSVPTLAPATVDSLSFPIALVTQHVYAIFDCQIDADAAPPGSNITFTMRIDGVVTDTRTVVIVGSTTDTIAMHSLYVALAPGVHTVDVQVQASVADYAIPAERNRLTIIVLPG